MTDATDIKGWIADLAQTRAQIQALRAVEDRCKEVIAAHLGDSDTAELDGRVVLTYKTTSPSEKLDTKRLLTDFGRKTLEAYITVTPGSRRMVLVEDKAL